MADIFYSRNAKQLLEGKKLYFIGDSNIRALYKDILCLLNHDRLLTDKQLKSKVEQHFLGDDLLRGSPLTKGRDFREDRRYKRNNLHLEFHFVTKCLNEDLEEMMNDFKKKKISPPDIVVMNSTQWDVNRWGPKGVELFKDNMVNLMRLLKSSLPPSTLVIWVTAPPISVRIKGGYMIKQLEFVQFSMRFHVMEANMFAQQLTSQFGFNCLDFHYYLQWQVHWRCPDGMHWSPKGMRFLGNLLLTHIALALRVPLPGNYHTSQLSKHKALARENAAAADAAQDEKKAVTLPRVPQGLMPAHSLPSPPRVRNPRPRPTRQHHGQHGQHGQNTGEPLQPRGANKEARWGNPNRAMGPPMGPRMGHPMGPRMAQPIRPHMGHHMGNHMGSQMVPQNHMGNNMWNAMGPPMPQYMGGNGNFGHGGLLPTPAPTPPLPRYPAPELPPLPSGPEPGCSNNYANDDYDCVFLGENGGGFFTEPQQIQSLWGPVRRNQGQAGRRQRPY